MGNLTLRTLSDLNYPLEILIRTKHPRIAEISNIGNPTLVLWGDEDRLVPVEDAPQRSAADVRAFLRGAI